MTSHCSTATWSKWLTNSGKQIQSLSPMTPYSKPSLAVQSLAKIWRLNLRGSWWKVRRRMIRSWIKFMVTIVRKPEGSRWASATAKKLTTYFSTQAKDSFANFCYQWRTDYLQFTIAGKVETTTLIAYWLLNYRTTPYTISYTSTTHTKTISLPSIFTYLTDILPTI